MEATITDLQDEWTSVEVRISPYLLHARRDAISPQLGYGWLLICATPLYAHEIGGEDVGLGRCRRGRFIWNFVRVCEGGVKISIAAYYAGRLRQQREIK